MKKSVLSICIKAILYFVLFMLAGVITFPVFWMISCSFKTLAETFRFPPTFLPQEPVLSSYFGVIEISPFALFYLNSLKVTSLITIGQLVICSMAAYAFSRLEFPGRDILFLIYLSSLMVPMQVTIIPIFILMKFLNLINTHSSLVLPTLSSAFSIFLLRQFFMTIPVELEDAARIDGASPFTCYFRIILPLSTPALATLAILQFTGYWNEFFRPLIFLHYMEKMTLPVGIVALAERHGAGNPSIQLAAASMATIPVIIIFLVFQKFYRRGITLSGLKG